MPNPQKATPQSTPTKRIAGPHVLNPKDLPLVRIPLEKMPGEPHAAFVGTGAGLGIVKVNQGSVSRVS
jgi:hypothetical protein